MANENNVPQMLYLKIPSSIKDLLCLTLRRLTRITCKRCIRSRSRQLMKEQKDPSLLSSLANANAKLGPSVPRVHSAFWFSRAEKQEEEEEEEGACRQEGAETDTYRSTSGQRGSRLQAGG